MYRFSMTIGDWSGDGHDKREEYIVVSNKPVEEVREAHFRGMAEVLDLTQICNEYEENAVEADGLPEWAREFFVDAYDQPGWLSSEPEFFAQLWVEVLKRADPELELELEQIPSLLIGGTDNQGRRCRAMGYGLFR